MADTQAMAAESLARIMYKLNPATGAALTTADGPGNVFLFAGGESQNSEFGATFTTVAAISNACLKRPASQNVSGATAIIRDCPITGAMTFLGEFVNGFANGYDATGLVESLDIPEASDASCLKWGATTGATTEWAMVELIGWRNCDNGEEQVRANIARKISAADPSRTAQFGLVDPSQGTVDYTLTMKGNAGFGAGPGGVLPSFQSDGIAVNGNPVSLGKPITTTALYTDLIALCACDSAVNGVPLTAALVAANAGLNTTLITGV